MFTKHDKTVYLTVCGPEEAADGMRELKANTEDAATEKHVPALRYEDGKLIVSVGSAAHPMLPEHFIEMIYVKTKMGGMLRKLKPGDKPEAEFTVRQEDVVAVYEHCNLHGLWMAEK